MFVLELIDALLTPVQDPSDAPNIKLSRDIPNSILLNYFLFQQIKEIEIF